MQMSRGEKKEAEQRPSVRISRIGRPRAAITCPNRISSRFTPFYYYEQALYLLDMMINIAKYFYNNTLTPLCGVQLVEGEKSLRNRLY